MKLGSENERKRIYIDVRDKVACLRNPEDFLVCDNSDYDVEFSFDEAWANYPVKTVLFVYGDRDIKVVMDGNVCEGVAIQSATMCLVGVYSDDIVCTTPAKINCLLSAKSESNGNPEPPTKDVYDEIIALLNRYINAVKGAPAGGTKGQVLKKVSDKDYDYQWEDDEVRDLTNYYTKEQSEFDYVFIGNEEFLNGIKNDISGIVLVKDVNIDNAEDDTLNDYTINRNVKEIHFINSSIYGRVIGSKTTRIIGLNGINHRNAYFPTLDGFGGVEFCRGSFDLVNCNNVIHSEFRSATNCENLQDVTIKLDVTDADRVGVEGCNLIDGVSFSTLGGMATIDFLNCSHLSNIINTTPPEEINYVNCQYVDGDTCDGYYTSEDVGKVKVITSDGTSQFASLKNPDFPYDFVFENEELYSNSLDEMSGDILVKGGTVNYQLYIPTEVKSIRFVGTDFLYEMFLGELDTPCQIYGNSTAKIIGASGDHIEIRDFGGVEDCHGKIVLYNCHNIINCSVSTLTNCSYANNVSRGNETEKVKYLGNCNHIDGNTCQDYFNDEENGKVQTVNVDGTKSLISVVEQITTPSKFRRVYGVDETGTQDVISIDNGYSSEEDVMEGGVAIRNANHSIYIPREPVEDTDAVNKAYIDTRLGDISTILTALHEGGIE